MEENLVENKQDQFMVNGSNERKDSNAARSKTNSKKKESISETTYEHLDCVIDDDPLGFENGWSDKIGKLEAQDPLEEVNLAEEGEKPKPTYVSSLLEKSLKQEIIKILKEFKDCFAREYTDMPGLDRTLV
ncbi:hypothetical protein A2U01_0031542 [Trifolium medium]|uniref:Uncharacterized protein n=1 Tax=Trifolium medium TaxID=97028 RepID=A0A392PG35_9FABA|nr:hypothetical protein [Trifolium medium]